ncbi:MAG: NAD(P)/FAD-dependent oxidoreductase, partial [Candidatus Marinimicrobia bacterium]|nr:NAD(P)/FAD-dependent oxidoreductase [Candidatus Neomarinimicrobiota bacterium]
MKSRGNEKITVVGGGLSGPVMAMYLAKKGIRVDIYERRPDMRKENISAGRSINLAISKRGITALEEIGVFHKISSQIIPMYGRKIHNIDESTRFLPYGRPDQYINSVSRSDLNILLLTEAEKTGQIRFLFQHSCSGMDLESGTVFFNNEVNGDQKTLQGTPVIAADGSGSAVRESMIKSGYLSGSFDPLGHSYKELSIPPDKSGEFQLEPNALHIWPRGKFMLIALPNMDRSFTVTLFLPNIGDISFSTVRSLDDLNSLFEKNFPDVLDIMPSLKTDYFSNPTGKLGTVRCSQWNVNESVLIGDAAHAVVPFFGQGMNASFEDCTVLNQMLDSSVNWKDLFESFSKKRKIDGDAIADMALENYIEMRDSVNKDRFLNEKDLERQLELKYPDQFISRYSMVSFHQIPYSTVQIRGAIQQEILDWILDNETVDTPVTAEEIE